LALTGAMREFRNRGRIYSSGPPGACNRCLRFTGAPAAAQGQKSREQAGLRPESAGNFAIETAFILY
jgi:hypothetical protein